MEHTKNETLNGKRTFWAMILFECAVLGLILFFCDVKYEVSDDFLMEAFLSGLYSGTPDYHIMFSGGLAGLLLYPLYQWIPTVSWYFFAQMAVCLLSYVAIARVITSSLSWKKAVPVIVLFTLFTASDVYVLPQFTKTAALAVIAGGILFLQSLFDNRKGGMVFGGLVLLGGLLIRLKMLYSALPFLGLYLLCLLLEKRMPVKELLRKGIVIAAAAVLVLVFRFANLAVSQNTEEYKDFAVWTGVRSSIVDYTRPDYSLIKEKMEEAGVSRNDYLVIRNWDFFDRSFLNIKTLRKVNKILGEYRSSQPFNLIQCMKSIKGRGTILYPGAILCMILGVICILFDPKRWYVPVGSAIILAGFFLYFAHTGREVYRAECGLYFFAAAVIAACISGLEGKSQNRVLMIGAAVIALALSVWQARLYIPVSDYGEKTQEEYRASILEMFHRSWRYDPDKYRTVIEDGEMYDDLRKEAENHPENLYIMDFNTTIQSLYLDTSVFKSGASQVPENLIYMGGVTANHPVMNHYLEKLGYADWMRALLEENAYLVCNNRATMIINYYHEHGYPHARAEKIGEIDGYKIYKIYESGK